MNEERKMNNEERLNFLNEKESEIEKREEKELTFDFDKALEESKKKEEYMTLKLGGRIFKIPVKMPYNFGIFFLRYGFKKVNGKMTVDLPDDKVNEFILLMFGQEFSNFLIHQKDQSISIEFVFSNIVPPILDKWGYAVKKMKEETKKKYN